MGIRRYDAGKKVNGRKRRIIVDTQGAPPDMVVHPANIQDRDGAKSVISKIIGRFPNPRLIWADVGYAGKLVDWVGEKAHRELEIVKRAKGERGFTVLPRRWVVKGTFAWLGGFRQLSEDYEESPQSFGDLDSDSE